jgi:hypothetical protein
VLGDRELPAGFSRVVLLLAPALLAALVITSAAADGPAPAGRRGHGGVAFAGLLLLRGVTVLPAVLAAAAMTALLRLAGVP